MKLLAAIPLLAVAALILSWALTPISGAIGTTLAGGLADGVREVGAGLAGACLLTGAGVGTALLVLARGYVETERRLAAWREYQQSIIVDTTWREVERIET